MSNHDGDRSSTTEAESDSDTAPGGKTYARRALSRVFIHLDKRLKAVPRKSALEKLKKAGRVKDIAFTRNHSAQEIERLLLANFPTLAGLDMSRLRTIISYDRGHSMEVVYKHVPSGNEIMEKFGGSNKKTVFLHWKPAKGTSPVSTNVTTQVQTNVTTVVCNITNTRTTSSTVTAVPSQIATTAISSNPATTPSGSTVHVPVPVSSSSSNTCVPGATITVQNSSVVTVAGHDAANAPIAGSAGSSILATSVITSPSQMLSVASTATTSSVRPRMSSRPAQSEASSLAPTNESDSDLLHSPFEDIHVVEVESDDQQDYLSARTELPETVGTIKEDLCPLGTVDSRNGKVPSHQLDRIQEVLLCEKELIEDNLNQPLPFFLNLSFDEMCHQGRIDHHLMVLVVLKEGDNYRHVQRFLSLLGNTHNIYFWIAKAGSTSGKQVLQKFGSKAQETGIFILAPTSSRPNLVERFFGQTLENISQNEVKDAIERGKTSLQGLRNEWERVQIRKDQELELEQCLRIDKKKVQATPEKCEGNDKHDAKADRIREDRNNRVAPEPEDGTTIVLRYGCLKFKRKFKTTALFQEVYDWAGSKEALPLHFTIQRRHEVVLHEHPITEREVLDVYEREEENVKELLDSQVTFRGNLPEAKEDKLSATVVDEVQKEKPRKERRVKERKKEKRARKESKSEKREASISKKKKKLKKGKQAKTDGAKKSITLEEDSENENREAKGKVEEAKEIEKEKEAKVQDEKEDKGEDREEQVEDAKEIGKEEAAQEQDEQENKAEDNEEHVQDEKEIGKEEAQVPEEKEDKGEDKKEHGSKTSRKRKKDKRTGSQRKKSKKE